MILNVNGQRVEITNWDEFAGKLLNGIGFQIESEIVKKINDLRLVDTGFFKRSINTSVEGNVLTISSDAPYATFLEYGTLSYWGKYGTESFPAVLDPKKKDLKPSQRKSFPAGMSPFAPFRRVLWNQNKMKTIIDKGVKIASR